jgi:hypothetical protein
VTITANQNPNAYAAKDSAGITKKMADDATPIIRIDSADNIKDFIRNHPAVGTLADLEPRRADYATWTCSSGDHLSATTVDEARVKYQFMMAKVDEISRTVDIGEYYTKGYCKVGEKCSLDKKPEFAALIRNLRAFLIEKSSLFNDIKERVGVVSSIEAVISRFKDSYYPGQQPNSTDI